MLLNRFMVEPSFGFEIWQKLLYQIRAQLFHLLQNLIWTSVVRPVDFLCDEPQPGYRHRIRQQDIRFCRKGFQPGKTLGKSVPFDMPWRFIRFVVPAWKRRNIHIRRVTIENLRIRRFRSRDDNGPAVCIAQGVDQCFQCELGATDVCRMCQNQD